MMAASRDFISLTTPKTRGFDLANPGSPALTLEAEPSPFDFDFNILNLDLSLDPGSFDLSSVGNATSSVEAANQSNKMWAAYLEQARKKNQFAAIANTVASAGDVFNSIVGVTSGINRSKEQRDNAIAFANNQKIAIETQAASVKAGLQSRFNTLIAKSQVADAARGIKVSISRTLEENKAVAAEIQDEFESIEGDVRLQNILLENEKQQAKLAHEATKDAAWLNLAGSIGNLAIAGATTGGTMAGWGNLFGDSRNLSKTVYGS